MYIYIALRSYLSTINNIYTYIYIYIYIEREREIKYRNSLYSIIVNTVLFQNVCDIISIRKFLFIDLNFSLFHLCIFFSQKGCPFHEIFKKFLSLCKN